MKLLKYLILVFSGMFLGIPLGMYGVKIHTYMRVEDLGVVNDSGILSLTRFSDVEKSVFIFSIILFVVSIFIFLLLEFMGRKKAVC